jgi:hypothetical protein
MLLNLIVRQKSKGPAVAETYAHSQAYSWLRVWNHMSSPLTYPQKQPFDAIDCFGAVLERVAFEGFLELSFELMLGLLELL